MLFPRFGTILLKFISVRSRRSGALLILLVSTLFFSGCEKKVVDPNDPSFIVAESPNWKITRGDLNVEIDHFLKAQQLTASQVGPGKLPIIESAMLNQLVLKKLLLAKAATMTPADEDKKEAAELARVRQHFPSDADFQAELKKSGMTLDEIKERIHEHLLFDVVFEKEVLSNVKVTEPEVIAFYQANSNKFKTPAKVRASRVVVLVDPKATDKDRSAKKVIIDRARARVAKGDDFGKVAQAVSEDQSTKIQGGDMGFFSAGENDPQFDAVAFGAKLGTLSPVFITPFGYEFIRVTDLQPAGLVSEPDARASITQYLSQEKQKQAITDYNQGLLHGDKSVIIHLLPPPIAPPAAPPASGAIRPAPAGQ